MNFERELESAWLARRIGVIDRKRPSWSLRIDRVDATQSRQAFSVLAAKVHE